MISLQVRKKDLAIPLNAPNDRLFIPDGNNQDKPAKFDPDKIKSLLVRKYNNKDKLDVWFKFESTIYDNLTFYTNTLRALWSDLYGENKSGSPKRFSSLMECINKNETIDNWKVSRLDINNSKDIDKTKWEFYKLISTQKIVYIRTSNMNTFVGGFLNTGFHDNGCAKKVTTYWDLASGKRYKVNPIKGWYVKAI